MREYCKTTLETANVLNSNFEFSIVLIICRTKNALKGLNLMKTENNTIIYNIIPWMTRSILCLYKWSEIAISRGVSETNNNNMRERRGKNTHSRIYI